MLSLSIVKDNKYLFKLQCTKQLQSLAKIYRLAYIGFMDDQIPKDEDSKVDYLVPPESGPGQKAVSFNSRAQQEKFLGGSSESQPKPQSRLTEELHSLYEQRGQKIQELNALKNKPPKFFGKDAYNKHAAQLGKEIDDLPIPLTQLNVYVRSEISELRHGVDNIINSVMRYAPIHVMQTLENNMNLTEGNEDLSGTLTSLGRSLDLLKRLYLPKKYVPSKGRNDLVQEAEKIDKISVGIGEKPRFPTSDEAIEQSKQAYLAQARELEQWYNTNVHNLTARRLLLGLLDVAKELAGGMGSNNARQRSDLIQAMLDCATRLKSKPT